MGKGKGGGEGDRMEEKEGEEGEDIWRTTVKLLPTPLN